MIQLYSTHCPKCKQLVAQLEKANIEFEEIDDVEYMKSIGLQGGMPKLNTPDGVLEFAEAWKWIKNHAEA